MYKGIEIIQATARRDEVTALKVIRAATGGLSVLTILCGGVAFIVEKDPRTMLGVLSISSAGLGLASVCGWGIRESS